VAKGGGIAFAGNFVGRFFAFLLQILLTRVLGVAGYGLYALGFSVLGITHTVSMLGLQNGVVRFGAMYHGAGDRARLKGTLLLAIGISFVSAVIVGTVLFVLASIIARSVFNEPDLTAPLRVFAFALPFYALVAMASFSARALRRIDYDVAISHLFRPVLTLLAVGTSFLLGYRLMGAVSGFLVSMVLSAGLGLYLLHRLFPDLTSKLRAKYEPKRLVLYSSTVLLVGLSQLLIMRTDRIMLGILGAVEDVGIYNAAATLAVQTTLFLVSFNAIFSPIIADLFHRGRKEELEALFKTTTKWIFTLTLPMVLVFALFARPIMRVFGAGFAAGGPVLISLGIAHLVNASVGSAGFILIMTGRQKLELMNNLILGGLNILLNLLLIPRFGVLGAGIATGLSIALVNLARLIEVYWLYKVHPYKLSCWKPMIAGAVAMAGWVTISSVLDLAGRLWLGGIGFLGLLYFLVLMLSGLDREDKLIIQSVKRHIWK
jgi:O-antigen/teichoic acid export membrane protein